MYSSSITIEWNERTETNTEQILCSVKAPLRVLSADEALRSLAILIQRTLFTEVVTATTSLPALHSYAVTTGFSKSSPQIGQLVGTSSSSLVVTTYLLSSSSSVSTGHSDSSKRPSPRSRFFRFSSCSWGANEPVVHTRDSAGAATEPP